MTLQSAIDDLKAEVTALDDVISELTDQTSTLRTRVADFHRLTFVILDSTLKDLTTIKNTDQLILDKLRSRTRPQPLAQKEAVPLSVVELLPLIAAYQR